LPIARRSARRYCCLRYGARHKSDVIHDAPFYAMPRYVMLLDDFFTRQRHERHMSGYAAASRCPSRRLLSVRDVSHRPRLSLFITPFFMPRLPPPLLTPLAATRRHLLPASRFEFNHDLCCLRHCAIYRLPSTAIRAAPYMLPDYFDDVCPPDMAAFTPPR